MELASSGPVKISEECGACSPRMAHYPALIWAISLFFHTKILAGGAVEICGVIGVTLPQKVKVWDSTVGGGEWARACFPKYLVSFPPSFLPSLPLSISPFTFPSLPHSIIEGLLWLGKAAGEKKQQILDSRSLVGRRGETQAVVCLRAQGSAHIAPECGCLAHRRRPESTRASGQSSGGR